MYLTKMLVSPLPNNNAGVSCRLLSYPDQDINMSALMRDDHHDYTERQRRLPQSLCLVHTATDTGAKLVTVTVM